MTATEMYNQFAQELNLSNNNSVTAYEVERFLNEAVYDYINRIIEQASPVAVAGTGYEASLWSMNMLAPIKMEIDATVGAGGFVPSSSDWMYWIAVRVQGPDACKDDEDWRDARFVSENEAGTFRRNRFTKPRYGSYDAAMSTQVLVRMIQRNSQPGLEVMPSSLAGKPVRIVYLRHPSRIQIKTPDIDVGQYSMVPGFIRRDNDVNCDLPAMAHPTIVRIAVNKFDQSVGNVEALQTGSEQLQQGYT